jgi:hypothetical protein
MMVWTSRILIGDMDGKNGRILGQKLGKCKMFFTTSQQQISTQNIPNGPDDPITTIN